MESPTRLSTSVPAGSGGGNPMFQGHQGSTSLQDTVPPIGQYPSG
jgi:hypothetical protein